MILAELIGREPTPVYTLLREHLAQRASSARTVLPTKRNADPAAPHLTLSPSSWSAFLASGIADGNS
ncbi:DUF397 domain-containing protein [Streptomyces sp. NPDC059629]|uniref:DUF397 domain-containing protein n=1 Tax=Streptomyces sp. NPDC059629 TaxID=3346889 RepID=UPI003688BF5A